MATTAPDDRTKSSPPIATPVVFEAIVKQLAIAASYNRVEVTLAPHIVYTKHGELYVDAITVDRDGKPPKEIKLGAFKLAGLSPLRITARRFPISSLFNPRDPRYLETTVMAVASN